MSYCSRKHAVVFAEKVFNNLAKDYGEDEAIKKLGLCYESLPWANSLAGPRSKVVEALNKAYGVREFFKLRGYKLPEMKALREPYESHLDRETLILR